MSLELQLSHWANAINGSRESSCDLHVRAVLRDMADNRGWNAPFQVLGTDENVYWVKMTSNPNLSKATITEYIVGKCGNLIGAPVCESSLIYIPSDLDGEVLQSGVTLKEGIAHASRHLQNAIDGMSHELEHRRRDNNRKRHAFYFAFHDWCWADDRQWLYCGGEDMSLYSHDHGMFFPGNASWTVETILQNVSIAHPIDTDIEGLDRDACLEVANRLGDVTFSDLREILSSVPASWPVANEELCGIGHFLESRATATAVRIREIANSLGSQL